MGIYQIELKVAASAIAAAARDLLRGTPVEPLKPPGSCEGRGCNWRGLAAAMAYYSARRAGIPAKPSEYYNRPPLYVPKQSFHNALNRLLEILGHSPLFKRVLYGRLGCLICRRPDGSVAWEYYGPGDPPACPRPSVLEEWPGPQSPLRLLWRGGTLKIRITTEWDIRSVIDRLAEAFGDEWFTASEAAQVLNITTPSASRLLRALEELGLLLSERHRGKNMKRYRVL